MHFKKTSSVFFEVNCKTIKIYKEIRYSKTSLINKKKIKMYQIKHVPSIVYNKDSKKFLCSTIVCVFSIKENIKLFLFNCKTQFRTAF